MQLVLYTHNKNTTQQIEIDCKEGNKSSNSLLIHPIGRFINSYIGSSSDYVVQKRMLIKSPSPFCESEESSPLHISSVEPFC